MRGFSIEGMLVVLALGWPGRAFPVPTLEPGLWETTVKLIDNRKLSPAQQKARDDLEKHLRSAGSEVPDDSKGQTDLSCLTPEQSAEIAADPERLARLRKGGEPGKCRSNTTVDAANRVTSEYAYNCTGTRPVNVAFVMYIEPDGKQYDARSDMRVKRGAADAVFTVESSARWLGADCGDVEPYRDAP